MRNDIPCEVIEDLLPLYADELTQEKTNEVMKEHLKGCESCRIKYENMTGQMGTKDIKEEASRKEIDYLKKIRQKNRNKIVLAAVLTMFLGVSVVLFKFFILGFPVENYQTVAEASGGRLKISGEINDENQAFKGYEIKNGTLIIYGTRTSLFNRNRQFTMDYDLKLGDIFVNGELVKSDGTIISKKAMELFKHKNPYIGGMPKNSALAGILEIYQNLGSFTNELQTTTEPYGWTLHFEQEILPANQLKFDSMMETYAAALLSLIENCGEITWTYGSGGQTITKTYTLQEADKRLGQDVKSFSASPEQVQKLLDLLNIK